MCYKREMILYLRQNVVYRYLLDDHKALATAIMDIMLLGKEGRLKLGDYGRRYAVSNYSYEVLANRFLEALK